MSFTMPFSENETKHLIFLLNCEYKRKRDLREKITLNLARPVHHLLQELNHLKDEMAANQRLVHKLDDHLTDLIRGHTLDEPNFLGVEANRHLKLLTTRPQNETD